jgi:NAD-dependent deacetylase
MTNTLLIEHAARILENARYGVALTGAGVSTPSGIPDFRSPGSGLWEHADPFEVASIWGFTRNPQKFYDWVRPLAHLILEAEPNPAHRALAALEAQARIRVIITQNIDNLHQRAGSKNVVEVHGHFREATCLRCNQRVPTQNLIAEFVASGLVPHCDKCGGVLKPKAVLFGENLPFYEVDQATRAVEQCDVMLVAGSSLQVAPVADWPFVAHARGAKIVIVNFEPTPLDKSADVVIHDDVAVVLPEVVRRLEREPRPRS